MQEVPGARDPHAGLPLEGPYSTGLLGPSWPLPNPNPHRLWNFLGAQRPCIK